MLIGSDRIEQWIDYFCSFTTSNFSWRFPLGVQCIIGSILAIGSLYIPESPRWLLDMDRDEEGMRVLADLHGEGDPDNELAKDEFREIKEGVLAEVSSSGDPLLLWFACLCALLWQRIVGDRSYRSMWKRYKYRVLIAMSAQMFAQLVSCSGIECQECRADFTFPPLSCRTGSTSSRIMPRSCLRAQAGLGEMRFS